MRAMLFPFLDASVVTAGSVPRTWVRERRTPVFTDRSRHGSSVWMSTIRVRASHPSAVGRTVGVLSHHGARDQCQCKQDQHGFHGLVPIVRCYAKRIFVGASKKTPACSRLTRRIAAEWRESLRPKHSLGELVVAVKFRILLGSDLVCSLVGYGPDKRCYPSEERPSEKYIKQIDSRHMNCSSGRSDDRWQKVHPNYKEEQDYTKAESEHAFSKAGRLCRHGSRIQRNEQRNTIFSLASHRTQRFAR